MIDDMVFRPMLTLRQKAQMNNKLMVARATRADRKGPYWRIGQKIRKMRERLRQRKLKRHMLSMRKVSAGRIHPLIRLGELAVNAVVTGSMAIVGQNTGMTFQQQSQWLTSFFFGDKPAELRAAQQLRAHIYNNPTLMGALAMGQDDRVFENTRPMFDKLLKMETARDLMLEKFPGERTLFEQVFAESKRKLAAWWERFQHSKTFREVQGVLDTFGMGHDNIK